MIKFNCWVSTFIVIAFGVLLLNGRPTNDDEDRHNEPSLSSKRMCRLPFEAGVCTESVTRFYYSPHTHQCVEFVYGGCNGNGNNFENKTVCEETCSGVNPCPYVAWVPGCTLKPNGENPDGCQIYDISCEPPPQDGGEATTAASVAAVAQDPAVQSNSSIAT